MRKSFYVDRIDPEQKTAEILGVNRVRFQLLHRTRWSNIRTGVLPM